MEYKRRIRVTNKSENQKRKRVNGRDGAPALMHRPAAIEAAPSPEKRGECSHTASKGTGILEREICAGQSTGAVQTPLLAYNRLFLNVQQHSIRRGTAPWAKGSTEVMEAALTGISGMWIVCFLVSVVWLPSLRGIRSCGGRHGLGSRLGLLGLFVVRFLLLGFD